jgi:hypothetical protein
MSTFTLSLKLYIVQGLDFPLILDTIPLQLRQTIETDKLMNQKLLNANNKKIRFGGIVYRIISTQLDGRVLADADPLVKGERINLVTTRSTLGRSLRNLIDLGLFV